MMDFSFFKWHRQQKYVLLLSGYTFCVGTQAQSAQIELLPPGADGLPVISVIGDLILGDEQTFVKVALPVEKAVVILDSKGGNLLAGIEIGKAIRLKQFSTFVSYRSVCASACALAWLGGIQRYMQPGAQIGFHAAYVQNGAVVEETGQGNAVAGAYLNQLGLPTSAVLYVTAAAPEEMNWLTADVARSVGIEVSILTSTEPSKSKRQMTPVPEQQVTPVPEQQETGDYLFDVLKKPTYRALWSKLIRSYKLSKSKPILPAWLLNYTDSFDGVATPGTNSSVDGRNVKIYWVAEAHNAGNVFVVLFDSKGGPAKGAWVDYDAEPRFLGSPSPAEKKALLLAVQ